MNKKRLFFPLDYQEKNLYCAAGYSVRAEVSFCVATVYQV